MWTWGVDVENGEVEYILHGVDIGPVVCEEKRHI